MRERVEECEPEWGSINVSGEHMEECEWERVGGRE